MWLLQGCRLGSLAIAVVALALVSAAAAPRASAWGPMKVKVFVARGDVGSSCGRVFAVNRVVLGPMVLTQTL